MSSRTEIKSVQEMLRSRLAPTDFKRFQAKDIENLVLKRFVDKAALEQATKEMLQDPPGDPLPGLLIKSLLEAFNPSALHKGKMFDLKACCFVFTSELHL